MSDVVIARPVTLFDPAREGPPTDAIDVQLRMPRSMQLWVDDLARCGHREPLGEALVGLEDLAESLVATAQRACGLVGEGVWPDEAQIALTPWVCATVPGASMARPHVHLYLGATGWRLSDGAVMPVAFESVRLGAGMSVWGAFFRTLRGFSEDLGHVWGRDPGMSLEIVDPPYAEPAHAAGYAPVCPGPWGPRRLIQADERVVAGAAASAAARRKQYAAGIRWTGAIAADGRPIPPETHTA